MKEKISELYKSAVEALNNAKDGKTLDDVRVRFLGKNGTVTELLKGMREVPAEERPKIGQLVNEVRGKIEKLIAEKDAERKRAERERALNSETIDVTMPGNAAPFGSLHPINLVRNEMIDCFTGMGFEIFEGPEIEEDEYNFRLLNIPKDHPARDMQDTFYFNNGILLRPHTSPGQVRTMENKKPPIKVLSPGRVYRADDDASHSPMFHQIEGLVIDKGVSLCDLKGLLDDFVKTVFDSDTKTRFRPSYFPFTEPSVEVDVTCCKCHGKGCSLCKGTGWIEILGAGVVNRKVLEMSGIDPDIYSGLAFGLGIERITMIKYGISDIRTLFENNVKFLKQFNRR